LAGRFVIGAPVGARQLAEYFEFRWQLLRAPFGLPRGSEQDELDAGSAHVTARDAADHLIGVGRLHMNSASEAQLRYMAVAESHRRQGVGRAIVAALEAMAIAGGASRMVLDARAEFLDFYTALGYAVAGPGPTKFGTLVHVRMEKPLHRDRA
jgi:GNAT superfamily N-acetyltransferase